VIAVSNASPLHYLILLGHAEVLPAVFNQVLIPSVVLSELQHAETPALVRDWSLAMPGWISVQSDPFPPLLDLPANLHAGETQAIQLAHHRKVPVVLLDDFDARRAAERQGLVVAGTLRLLAEGSLAGLLSLPEAFGRLRQTNFRASERLYAALLAEVEARR
jgi:predicted nucleic acid-binding protein